MLKKIIKIQFICICLTLLPLSAEKAKKESTANVGDLMEKIIPNLVNSKGEKVEDKNIKNKDYIVIYWSASWCGPCRKFTPKLVDFYEKNVSGGKFEVILVSVDKSEDKMKAYMQKNKMKWNTIDFPNRCSTGIKAFAKGGIPRMMIFDKKGDILARGNAFSVFNKLKELVEKKSSEK